MSRNCKHFHRIMHNNIQKSCDEKIIDVHVLKLCTFQNLVNNNVYKFQRCALNICINNVYSSWKIILKLIYDMGRQAQYLIQNLSIRHQPNLCGNWNGTGVPTLSYKLRKKIRKFHLLNYDNIGMPSSQCRLPSTSWDLQIF